MFVLLQLRPQLFAPARPEGQSGAQPSPLWASPSPRVTPCPSLWASVLASVQWVAWTQEGVKPLPGLSFQDSRCLWRDPRLEGGVPPPWGSGLSAPCLQLPGHGVGGGPRAQPPGVASGAWGLHNGSGGSWQALKKLFFTMSGWSSGGKASSSPLGVVRTERLVGDRGLDHHRAHCHHGGASRAGKQTAPSTGRGARLPVRWRPGAPLDAGT